MSRIWVDVEDLFQYVKAHARPSGIQRLSFEIYRALWQRLGQEGRVGFLRHDPLRQSFTTVPWSAIAGLFEGMMTAEAAPAAARRRPRPAGSGGAARLSDTEGRHLLKRAVYRLPDAVRQPLILGGALQIQAAGAFAAFAREALRHGGQALWPASVPALALRAASVPSGEPLDRVARPGDSLLTLGSPWFHPDYAGLIRRGRDRLGIRPAMLVNDIIPLRRPEWCDAQIVRMFKAWIDSTLPVSDLVLAISRATAADVERYAREQGIPLSGPVVPIPIGTGFGGTEQPPAEALARRTDLPEPGTYALFVSTIEARKNHALLFRVWRRLLEELPRDRVPTLVFAGRTGWLVDDLMQQLRNARYLDGKVLHVEDATDADLAALYRGCRFTLFPSFYEGWGLPVTESLAFGKPCLVSNTTSLPEAGGTLARYFDPDNLHDAYRAVREVIEDPAGLAAWEAQVVREFHPVSWDASAAAVIAALEQSEPAAAEAVAGGR